MIKVKDQNFIAIFYILLSILIASTAAGINIIAFPAVLIQNNVAPFFVGISSTVEILANIAISFYISRIILRLSITGAALFFAITFSISILLIYFYQNLALWLFFCMINGACWLSLYVIRQSWINYLTKNEHRSIVLALTTTVFCCGFMAGSFVIKYFGAQNYTSFIISAALVIIAVLILLPIKFLQPKTIDSKRIGFIELFKNCPQTSAARFCLELQAGCLVYLSVIFGAQIGLSAENSGLLVSAYMASGFFDLYAGFLVKKYNRYKMMTLGLAGCLSAILIALFFYQNYIVLLVTYFFFGCGAAMVLVASLTIVNESFAKEKLVAANSTFQSVAAIGNLIGSFIGGAFIEIWGFYGFFATIILANLCYFIFLIFHEKNQTRS